MWNLSFASPPEFWLASLAMAKQFFLLVLAPLTLSKSSNATFFIPLSSGGEQFLGSFQSTIHVARCNDGLGDGWLSTAPVSRSRRSLWQLLVGHCGLGIDADGFKQRDTREWRKAEVDCVRLGLYGLQRDYGLHLQGGIAYTRKAITISEMVCGRKYVGFSKWGIGNWVQN